MSHIMQLRPQRAEDEPFLKQLRGQIDTDRLFLDHWVGDGVEQEKTKILDFQFRALSAHQKRAKNMAETKENIIEMDGVPIGRFIVSGGRMGMRLTEISLVPEWRGKGIGQSIVTSTMQECSRTGRVLNLCVEMANINALRFYLSLGFYKIDEEMGHYQLEWNPRGPTDGKLYSFAKS